MNIFKKWKIMREVNKKVAESLAREYEQNLRREHLLNTEHFSEVIKELFNECQVGCSVIITFTNGNKVEINRKPENLLPRDDMDKPYF